MVEDVVNDGVDIGDVDLVVSSHVAHDGPAISVGAGHTGVTATAATIDDDVNHVVDISNVDLAVTVHVSKEIKDGISID